MEKKELLRIQKLADGIGQFIRYWGFRKIHGQIWAVVYLSPSAMSGIEIGKTLKVSKALVSTALKQLEAEGLILQTKSENTKTKRYIAEEDVSKIIHGVLMRREVPMIERIQERHRELRFQVKNNKSVNLERLEKMGMMIQMAQMALLAFLESDQLAGCDGPID